MAAEKRRAYFGHCRIHRLFLKDTIEHMRSCRTNPASIHLSCALRGTSKQIDVLG